MKLPVVAVVGRPNVGKSTFFNRVLGERIAIVEDRPGVTRDRNYARTEWNAREFYLVDTGGMVENSDEPMDRLIRDQVMAAIGEADVLVQIVDGKAGPHPLDYAIAEHLRKTQKPVVLLVNKMDNLGSDTAVGHHDFWDLGIGEPQPVSSLSGKGSGDVLDQIVWALPEGTEAEEEALRVAVIGRPNVGKSSFVNRLLGEERLVVSDVAGTTRDAIDTPMKYHGRTFMFVDTAGLRRQSRIDEGVEFYSAIRTERAIDRADVCVLILDATMPIAVQDLKIAEKAWGSGKGLIIIANKWDLVEKETMTAPRYEKDIRERAPYLQWVPILFTSARTGQRVNRALELILEVQQQRQRRVATHEVNDVLRSLVGRTKPPTFAGHSIRFLYGTQVATEPPTFVFWVNIPEGVTESYQRYLMNGFRAAWGFNGAPIVIRLRRREDTEARRPRQGKPHAPDEVEDDGVEVAYVRGDGPGGREDEFEVEEMDDEDIEFGTDFDDEEDEA
ncbi:ribosome biogenesis GTPase Der [Longimicrobium sp.]|uniref:ribosome biogenesis GTPase Der n=1 Tax=Longimicrobium sp. TaxID=2029185 RepID=UPI002E3727A6|nr:ribosome biogenesis GTPase Der [Longimicrobium sp.]HEX6040787.1 ribosome biogenesis GTPase Der [Longimicrobium sp.]